MPMSAVFAMCARSTARTLPKVLKNVEAMARLYEHKAFVFVENDSTDDSKALLKAWCAARPDATLIDIDGLEAAIPARTERLAACRNAYLDFIKASPFADHRQLIVLDADEINEFPIDLEAFRRGRNWLAEHREGAVFANPLPRYYDIWALRHAEWCPRDYLEDIEEAAGRIGKSAARRRFIYDRQVQIPTTAEPIRVDSAFGGLAVYRMTSALDARYDGLDRGRQTCEHVAFNHGVGRYGRRLFILPWMTIGSADARSEPPCEQRSDESRAGGRRPDY